MFRLCSGHVGIWCQMCAGSLAKLDISSQSCLIVAGSARAGCCHWVTRPGQPAARFTHPSKTSMKLTVILSVSGQIFCGKSRVPSLFSNLSKLYMTEFPPKVTPQFFSISKTNTKRKTLELECVYFPFPITDTDVWTIRKCTRVWFRTVQIKVYQVQTHFSCLIPVLMCVLSSECILLSFLWL